MRKRRTVAVAALATCSVAVALGALSLSCDETGGIFGAQPPWDGGSLIWAKRPSGIGTWDEGTGIAVLSDGSALVTGCFWTVATFGPGEPNETTIVSAGFGDVFAARYEADGTLAWAKRAGAAFSDAGTSIAALSDGSAFVTGYYEGTATFGPGESKETPLASAGGSDIFVARHDADGALAWAKRAGGTSSEVGRGIAVLPDGSALVTGEFRGTATFGPGELNETPLTFAGWDDIFIARYNADGTLAWARRAGGTDYEWGEGIAVLSDGSAFVTGPFYGAATFGPGEASETTLTSAGGSDVFIARYNADGTLAWAKRAGGASGDIGHGTAVLPDGSALVTGEFQGAATFGSGEPGETAFTSAGALDAFVARYNADGALAWAKRAGGASDELGKSIAALSEGSAFVTGYFRGTATFGPGESKETTLASAGQDDVFIARYNADGTLAWAKRAGGTSFDGGGGIAVLSDGSALVTGDFAGTATFGPGEPDETALSTAGGNDIFIARFKP